MPATSRFPHGLATGSGLVGKGLLLNGGSNVLATFEHSANGFKGAPVTAISHEHYELEKSLGFIGGGGIDFRFAIPPIAFATKSPPGAPSRGREYWRGLKEQFNHTVVGFGHSTSL